MELTSLLRQLVVGQHQQNTQVCGICTSVEHPTDMCPTLQETKSKSTECIGAVGGRYQYGRQPYPNWKFDNQQFQRQPYQPNPSQGQYTAPRFGLVRSMPGRTVGRHYKSDVVGQFWKHPFTNDTESKRGGAGTVRLRSSRGLPQLDKPQLRPVEAKTESGADSRVQQLARGVPLLFPNRTVLASRFETEEDLLKLFRKVEINISLLKAIKQVSKYAKFLKELYIHKRKKIKGAAKTGGIVSALMLVPKFNESCQRNAKIFSVPCTIGNDIFTDAMLDLGASINVMPALAYKSLNFGDLEPIGMEIQLANKSVVQPLGVLEDVLIHVNKLIFPADFYVLDMEDEALGKGSALI
ncbi:hypothetical protein CR513_21010, partial [Mucuna pruriens]